MDISHLQTFCTVIESGSISKAARKLFVTQPAISVKIQEMEQHYQVQLLERTNKGVAPTDIGSFLYEEGKRVIAMMDNISKQIEHIRNPVEELMVGASSTIGNFALPCTIFIFKERFPNYKILMDVHNTSTIIDRLIMRRLEMGLVEGPLSLPLKDRLGREGVFSRWLMRSKLVLVVPNKEPYLEMDTITIDEFLKLPLIIREEGSGIRANLEQTLLDNDLVLSDLNIAHEMNSVSAIISTVSSDMGVTLLPKMAVRKELRYKILKTIQVEGLPFYHDFTLLYYPQIMKKQAYNSFFKLLTSKERGFC